MPDQRSHIGERDDIHDGWDCRRPEAGGATNREYDDAFHPQAMKLQQGNGPSQFGPIREGVDRAQKLMLVKRYAIGQRLSFFRHNASPSTKGHQGCTISSISAIFEEHERVTAGN